MQLDDKVFYSDITLSIPIKIIVEKHSTDLSLLSKIEDDFFGLSPDHIISAECSFYGKQYLYRLFTSLTGHHRNFQMALLTNLRAGLIAKIKEDVGL